MCGGSRSRTCGKSRMGAGKVLRGGNQQASDEPCSFAPDSKTGGRGRCGEGFERLGVVSSWKGRAARKRSNRAPGRTGFRTVDRDARRAAGTAEPDTYSGEIAGAASV